MKTFIKNGHLIDPSQKINTKTNIIVQNGKVAELTKSHRKNDTFDTVINAEGLVVSPGLIDMHTHLREPGEEHKETIRTGSQAAAAGGFTTIVAMANTKPVNDNPYITQYILLKAKQQAIVNVYTVGALSKNLEGEEMAELGALKEAGCIAISDDGMPVMNSYFMRKAMDYAKQFGLTIISHAEDENLVGKGVIHEGLQSTRLGLRGNPGTAEEILIARDVALSELTQCKLHFAHVTTAAGVRIIKEAKSRHVPISAEVSPHHLTLTDEAVSEFDPHFKMAPPLRTKTDIQALKRGLKDGTIDAFATDHAPHTELEKNIEFEHAANGVIGLETALPITLSLVHDKTLSLSEWVSKWTTGPATILNLKKGSLKVGWDADMTLFNPKTMITIDQNWFQSKSRNTPFHGKRARGKIHSTIVGGKIVYEN